MGVTSPAIDARWLEALHRLASRSAHELKGALNGVSVNLEVIRSRTEKAGVMASAVNTFAAGAANQLDGVIALSEALLGLTRPAREPVELGVEVQRIIILLGAAARADGRQLAIDDPPAFNGLGVTSAAGSAVRLAICESMLAAVDASAEVHCTAFAERASATIRVEAGEGNTLVIDEGLVVAVKEAGIHIQVERSAISISFPR